MTNTEFISRASSQNLHDARWFRAGAMRFGVADAVLVLIFLAAFMGLVFLLAK
jgi:hypothetical protein